MRKAAIGFICTVVLLCVGVRAQVSTQAPEDKAHLAAEQWIVLVDDGQYEESWKQAAKIFQDAVSASDWQQKTQAERTQLGERRSRKLKDVKLAPRQTGLPAGEYILVKYESSFVHKKTATETITTVLEPDGNWRVAAYSLK